MEHSVTHIAAVDSRRCVVRQSQLGTIVRLVNTSFAWICSSFNGNREQPKPDNIIKGVAHDSWCWCILQTVPDYCNDDATARQIM
jgi:hypothetical protein